MINQLLGPVKKSETPDLENNVFKEYFFRTE